jgi:hypothetical protein
VSEKNVCTERNEVHYVTRSSNQTLEFRHTIKKREAMARRRGERIEFLCEKERKRKPMMMMIV